MKQFGNSTIYFIIKLPNYQIGKFDFGLSSETLYSSAFRALRFKSSLVPRCGLSAAIAQPLNNSNSIEQYAISFYFSIIKKDFEMLRALRARLPALIKRIFNLL